MCPIYEMRCPSCNEITEHITFSIKEKITIPLCAKCQKKMEIIPSPCHFSFVFDSGVWEKQPDGTEKYKGKGGKKGSIPGFEGKLPKGRDFDLDTRSHLFPKQKPKTKSVEKGPSFTEETRDIIKKGDYELIKDK